MLSAYKSTSASIKACMRRGTPFTIYSELVCCTLFIASTIGCFKYLLMLSKHPLNAVYSKQMSA